VFQYPGNHKKEFFIYSTPYLLLPLVEQVRYNTLAALQLLIKTDGSLFNFRDAPLQLKLEINQTFSNMSNWT